MGWTRKSYRDSQACCIIVVLFVVLLLNLIRVYTREFGLSDWVAAPAFIPVLIAATALALWFERRFERSAEPTEEQREAWDNIKRRRRRLVLLAGPALAVALVQMDTPLPWFVWSPPFAVALAAALVVRRTDRAVAQRFQDSLIWFDESWTDSPLSSVNPQREAAADER